MILRFKYTGRTFFDVAIIVFVVVLACLPLLINSCSPDANKDQKQVDQPVDSLEYVVNNFEEIPITVSKDGSITVNDGSVDICEVGDRIANQVDDPRKHYVRLLMDAETNAYHIYCINEQLRDIGLHKQVQQIEGDSKQMFIRLLSFEEYDQIEVRVLANNQVQFVTDTIHPNEVETQLKTELDNKKKLWIRFSGDRSSSYETYLAVYNKIKELVNDRYEQASQKQFGKSYAILDSLEHTELSNVVELMVSESACMCK